MYITPICIKIWPGPRRPLKIYTEKWKSNPYSFREII